MGIDFEQLAADDLGPGTDNPAALREIIARAALLTDKVPVLLLPVRLETRFMQVERPVDRPPTLTALIEALEQVVGCLASIASRKLGTRAELPAEQDRSARRTRRKLGENEAFADLMRAIASARAAVAKASELALDAVVGTAESIAAVIAAGRRIEVGLRAAKGAVAQLRSPYQRDQAEQVFATLVSEVLRLRQALEQRALPTARLRSREGGSVTSASTLRDELWVRIFPDDIAVDTHEEQLTSSELASAAIFWTETAAASGDGTLARGAWRGLCQRHGTRRAAWIAHQTEPKVTIDPAEAAVVRALEVLSLRLDEIAAAGVPARRSALDRAVADLAAGIPTSTEADHAVLERATPLLTAVRARLLKLGVAAHRSGIPRGEFRRARARTLATIKLLRTWLRNTGGATVQPRSRGVAERRPSRPPTRAGGSVERALRTFGARLEEIETWHDARAVSWTKALARAFVGVQAALASDALVSVRIRERAERLMASTASRLRGLVADRRRNQLPDAVLDSLERQARSLHQAWERWRARASSNPREVHVELPSMDPKAGAWTTAASSTVLPDRYVVVTVAGDRVTHVVVGKPVPADLKLGLDPDPAAGPAEEFSLDDTGSLIVGASIKWMVDYREARDKGMAITVPITAAEAQEGFERVYVLGLCSGGQADGANRLAALLESHHYGRTGLALLPIGTPTNNTEEAASGYRSTEDPEAAFAIERGPALFEPVAPPHEALDGLALTRALGLPPETLAHVQHADGRDVADAALVNAALYPATLGHYLEEFFGSLIPVPVLDRLKHHALANVSARGMVPGLRVGSQPYGILPTTAFSKFDTGEAPGHFLPMLSSILQTMNTDWTRLRKKHVRHAHWPDVVDAQQHFLEMVGLEGVSVSAEYRFALNCARRQPPASGAPGYLDFGMPGDGSSAGAYGPAALIERFAEAFRTGLRLPAGEVLERGQVGAAFNKAYRRLTKARAYEVRYLAAAKPLVGATVGDHAAYIPQMLGLAARTLAAQAASGDAEAKPLLYLLLRQALLLETREAALRILAVGHMLTPEARRRAGESDVFSVHTLTQDWSITRWSYLFEPLRVLDGRFGVAFPTGPGTLYSHLGADPDRAMDAYLSPRTDNPIFRAFTGWRAHADYVEAMAAHANVVGRLAGIQVERLEQLVLEHLDGCSHRLDAWITSLAHARLSELRVAAPTGLHVGAFGWLEDLSPDGSRPLAAGVPPALAAGSDSPIHLDQENQGFIHAPSVNHAITAAILRSGYLSEAAQPDIENKMAVNLSSRRVRLAEELIEGVRQGNDLGSMLGYQFERHLHESFAADGVTLDDLIAPFRRAFPSMMAVDPALASSDTATRRVVDGLSLVQTALNWVQAHPRPEHRDRTLYEILRDDGHYAGHPYGLIGESGEELLPASGDPAGRRRLDGVLRGLDRIADALDAVGDLVVSEGVYQLVQGNHARAAAATGALAQGKAPPTPEIIRTPRSGVVVSHRLLLAIEPIDARSYSAGSLSESELAAARQAVLPAAWAELPSTARARAEPSLNRWLGARLGAPELIAARVDVGLPGECLVTAADLGLQPIDLLVLLGPGFEAGVAELTARVLATLRPDNLADDAPPLAHAVELSWTGSSSVTVRSFADAGALLEAVFDLVSHGSAASGHDFASSEGPAAPSGVVLAELEVRTKAALAALQACGLELLDLLTEGRGDPALLEVGDLARLVGDEEALLLAAPGPDGKRRFIDLDAFWSRRRRICSALTLAAGFGIPRILPSERYASEGEVRMLAARELLERLQSALLAVAVRWRAASAAEAARAVATDPARGMTALLKVVFGEAFPALPLFSIAPDAEVLASLAGAPAPSGDLTLSGWLHGVSMVRERASSLVQALILIETFGGGSPDGRPAQLPHVPGEPWLGATLPDNFVPPSSRISLSVFGAEALATDGAVSCALLIDHWDESIPARDELTGVAIHYDQPDAMPPQSLLLVVPPVRRGTWRWHDLLQAMHETLELAKNRAVELEHLQDDLYGQILPAIVGELVPEAATPAMAENPGSRVILDFGRNNPPPPVA